MPPLHADVLRPLKITEESVMRRMTRVIVERGRLLLKAGAVLDYGIEDNLIKANVQGSQPEPYHQVIRVLENGTYGETFCSCPMGTGCKHIAAVLLDIAAKVKNLPPESVAVPNQGYEPPYEVYKWIDTLKKATAPPVEDYSPAAEQMLVFLLTVKDGRVIVRAEVVRRLKNGNFGGPTPVKPAWLQTNSFPKDIIASDRELVQWLVRYEGFAGSFSNAEFALTSPYQGDTLRKLVQTGRLQWQSYGSQPLHLGEPRRAQPEWTEEKGGTQTFHWVLEGGGIVLPTIPLWYANPESGAVGPLECGLSDSIARAMYFAPAIPQEAAHFARGQLLRDLPEMTQLAPLDHKPPVIRQVDPVPHLHVMVVKGKSRWTTRSAKDVAAGRLHFIYDKVKIRSTSTQSPVKQQSGEEVTLYLRDTPLERKYQKRLEGLGWTQYHSDLELPPGYGNDYVLEQGMAANIDSVIDFAFYGAEELRREGWIVQIDPAVATEILPEPELSALVDETSGIDWFGLQLGAIVGEERIDLAPVLARAFFMLRSGKRAEEGKPLLVRLEDGRVLPLSIDRIQPLIKTLVQLYGEPDEWAAMKKLPKWRLLDLEALRHAEGLKWSGSETLRDTASKLAQFERVEPVDEPEGFAGTLRDYQRQGVGWLQFLSRFDFGGILADDMGLGKTVQTLAHLVYLKNSGAGRGPSLLVAPTSTLPNWKAECAKFAPELKVLLLHGASRKKLMSMVPDQDLVVTTYPLLPRDKEDLLKNAFDVLILDEAQNVKNHQTAAAFIASQIKARQRLCLSGTPVENHLGELWSLFHILMPGLLGNEESFRRRFRGPVEKGKDKRAQEELSRLTRPFILRRTKEEVAKELPPKTEIQELVEFDAAQRDLYETVRVAMDKRVRDALAQQGLGKSHIVILDALLKLRQTCCDPKLVKVEAAREVKSSAKLERLMEMLPEMIEEGRRILLFSQFTSMLELIESAVQKAGIPYVKLTGDTKDRAKPVQVFQNREVPLFLISLKAGGTGLNLTAADTVIHYDPWWNPAVERQATDRAHRIGQTMPVFVYKLVVKDTIEEKILELQTKKAGLAEALLDGESGRLEITKDDLEWIFGGA